MWKANFYFVKLSLWYRTKVQRLYRNLYVDVWREFTRYTYFLPFSTLHSTLVALSTALGEKVARNLEFK